MALADRDFVPAEAIASLSASQLSEDCERAAPEGVVPQAAPLGVMFAWVTHDDAHTPVMLDTYDQVFELYEQMIPMFFVDARADENSSFLDPYLIYSVPTLLLVKDGKTLTRHIGTTMVKKIRADVDKVVEDVLASN